MTASQKTQALPDRETMVPWLSRHRPVNFYLLFLILACLVPGLIGGIGLVWHSNRNSQQALEQSSIQTARVLMELVDGQLLQSRAILQSLVSYDGVHKRDFSALHQRAQKIIATTDLATRFSLTDKHGQLIFSTSRPFGEALPKHGNPAHIQRVIQSRKPAISNLFIGSINHDHIVTVDMPVIIDNEVEFVLTSALRPEVFTRLFQTQGLPEGWLVTVVDQEGNFITRIPDPDKYVGQQRNDPLFKAMQAGSEGAFKVTALDGTELLAAYSRSQVTGWSVALGTPLKPLEAGYKKPFHVLLASVTLLFVLVATLAAWMSRRISGSIRALVEPARKLGQGEPVSLMNVAIKEADEVAHALVDACRLLRQRTEALDAEKSTRLAQLEQMVAERTQALAAATKQAEELARRDALTGLLNRLAAHERLQEEFHRTKRTGEPYTALLMDIDHFKLVNDTYGHETGDRVLKVTADLLAKSVRSTDFVFRFGGEEFLVLLPGTALDGAEVIAEKIRADIEAHQFASWLQVTISIGISVTRDGDVNDHDVVRRADAALYMAKNGGRNQVKTC